MKYIWLNKQNNKGLIVFMNGWGMDEDAVKHLSCKNYDVLTIYDYRIFNDKLKEFDFSKYDNKYLISWSMGVYVSNLFKNSLNKFDKKIAIAGTSKIINNEFGIPEKIYNLTIKNFSDKSASQFIKNMFLNIENNIKTKRTTEELKEELISIQNLKIDNYIEYNKVFIPKFDKIIPYKNQINFWMQTNANIVEVESPHYLFNNFSSWQEIIC